MARIPLSRAIAKALARPHVTPSDVADATGLSYRTVISDIRAGYCAAVPRRRRTRTYYLVTRRQFVAYLESLGYECNECNDCIECNEETS